MQSAPLHLDDLETYTQGYGTHGAIQRLGFVAATAESKALKVSALERMVDLLKRTTNTKLYTEATAQLRVLSDTDAQVDSVWVEATQKQSSILHDVYEQDLHQAKLTQAKEGMRGAHQQLANFYTEMGDYQNAQKFVSKSREYCTETTTVLHTCMTVIKLSALLRQYTEIHSFASKAMHTPYLEQADQSKIQAAFGLYYMSSRKYRDAALAFAQVKVPELGDSFKDVLSAQDVALYGSLCALASLDRPEVQEKLLNNPSFQECLVTVPAVLEMTENFCNWRYAACLGFLEHSRSKLLLDVHLHGQVDDLCQNIRNKAIVQYFQPFLSVSLHSMAQAFNTDVEGMQSEVAQLVRKGQLDAKIDSQAKTLVVRSKCQRALTYQKALRVAQDYIDDTNILILRMNLIKSDFGVHMGRSKKGN